MSEAPIKQAESLQVLSLYLDNECFAIEIDQIQEVIEFKSVTRVPRAPEYLCGVINLRGKVIPVVDLRLIFGISITEPTLDTCIIIIEIEYHGEICAIGVVADSVKEVVEFEIGDIRPAPKIGMTVDNRFISGMVEYDDDLITLLSINKIFSDDELDSLIEHGSDQANQLQN